MTEFRPEVTPGDGGIPIGTPTTDDYVLFFENGSSVARLCTIATMIGLTGGAVTLTNLTDAISTHNSDTTSVHGITDTSALALTANVLAKSGGTMTGSLVTASGLVLQASGASAPGTAGQIGLYVNNNTLGAWRNGDTDSFELAPGAGGMTAVTASDYTLVLADNGRLIDVNSSSARVITVPTNASVAFPLGSVIEVYRAGTGSVTITPASGVTIRNNAAISAQYGLIRLYKRDTNEWVQTPLGGAVGGGSTYTYTVAAPATQGADTAASVNYSSFTAQAGDALWCFQRNAGNTLPAAPSGSGWVLMGSQAGTSVPAWSLYGKVAAGGEASVSGLTGKRSVIGALRPTGGSITSANLVSAGSTTDTTGSTSKALTSSATASAGDLFIYVGNHNVDVDALVLTNEFATGTAMDFRRGPNNTGTNETFVVSIADPADGTAPSTTETWTTTAASSRGFGIFRAPT